MMLRKSLVAVSLLAIVPECWAPPKFVRRISPQSLSTPSHISYPNPCLGKDLRDSIHPFGLAPSAIEMPPPPDYPDAFGNFSPAAVTATSPLLPGSDSFYPVGPVDLLESSLASGSECVVSSEAGQTPCAMGTVLGVAPVGGAGADGSIFVREDGAVCQRAAWEDVEAADSELEPFVEEQKSSSLVKCKAWMGRRLDAAKGFFARKFEALERRKVEAASARLSRINARCRRVVPLEEGPLRRAVAALPASAVASRPSGRQPLVRVDKTKKVIRTWLDVRVGPDSIPTHVVVVDEDKEIYFPCHAPEGDRNEAATLEDHRERPGELICMWLTVYEFKTMFRVMLRAGVRSDAILAKLRGEWAFFIKENKNMLWGYSVENVLRDIAWQCRCP